MDTYTDVSYELTKTVTERYSTSFSMSSRLFDASIRKHIYAVYGLVRIADEVVDAYRKSDAGEQLATLQAETLAALASGYSTNPIVHAFADTARLFDIQADLINPFFASMRTDLTAKSFTQKEYEEYIYGSAEVVGLMCLKVFLLGNRKEYAVQKVPASALGSAYQKVNFLRDMKADYTELGRVYFPGVTFDSFNDAVKDEIVRDIEHDFAVAIPGIEALPITARRAVQASYYYYSELLAKLKTTSAETIMSERIRLPNSRKLLLLMRARRG